MNTNYDYWRTREPDYDAEAEARIAWEEDVAILEVIGQETASMILWDLYNADNEKDFDQAKDRLWKAMDKAWNQYCEE
jgi:hypothetical protein